MKKLLYLLLAITVACSSGDDSTTADNNDPQNSDPQNNDTTPPVITLIGSSDVSVFQGDEYVDEGATATDNVDGDLTSNITVSGNVDTVTIGNYTLTYSVSDSSGNSASASRNVEVIALENNDITPPVITLIGSADILVIKGDNYVDEGATATDDVDGDLTSSISVSGNVDTATIGNYTLTYSVSDSSGNSTSASRNVEVTEINPDLVGAWTTTFSDGNSTAIQVLTLNSDGTGSVSNEWDHGETFFSELIWTCDVTTIYSTTLINNETDSGDYELSNNNDTLVINTNGMVLVYVRI